jgi:anti-anti-sigma factor
MADFERRYIDDIVVIKVNLMRATLVEAKEFTRFINSEIEKKKLKIIFDLSLCEFMDSTFIGALVVTLKRLTDLKGELRLVKPTLIAQSIMAATATLNIFNLYETTEDALENLNLVNSRQES